jgi:hypothetical protein
MKELQTIETEYILSTHASERMVHRFKLSTYNLIKLIELKAYIAFDHTKKNDFLLAWSATDKRHIILVRDKVDGLIITVWNEQIYKRQRGKKISSSIKQELRKICLEMDLVEIKKTKEPDNTKFNKKNCPNLELCYLDTRAGRVKTINLGRINCKVCACAFKTPQKLDPFSLIGNQSFLIWVKQKLSRKTILEKDIIGFTLNAENIQPITILYNG